MSFFVLGKEDVYKRQGYIRAWNESSFGGNAAGLAIIDCMMNIPLLYWASEAVSYTHLGILMAFKDFSFRDGILGSPWNDFAHFKRLFASPDFYNVLKNSIVLNLLKIVFCFPVPIILAIMLNEIRYRCV